jgi:hypothetical protein
MNTILNLLPVGSVEKDREFINELQEQYEQEIEPNNTTFRGTEIEWITNNKYKTTITQNAFSPTEPYKEEAFTGKNHLINYGDNSYTNEQFFKAMFADYKKYPYKVIFSNDNVFYLGSSQRAKLQYHILAQNFHLADVCEQDKKELQALYASHKAETAQRYLNRMTWEQGLEKMITFGVALAVREAQGTSKAKGVYCYTSYITSGYAAFSGVCMTWENWVKPIIDCLDNGRKQINAIPKSKKELIKLHTDNVYQQAIMILFYQNGKYLTLPKAEYDAIQAWIYSYLNKGNTPFPYSGTMPNGDIQFKIDFETDIEIVKAHDLKTEMSEYNAEHNAEHNQDIGRDKVKQTFSRLDGNEWTTQEILRQGYNEKNIKRFVDYGLIERTKRGHYRRI